MQVYSLTPFVSYRRSVGIVQFNLLELPEQLTGIADELGRGAVDIEALGARFGTIANHLEEASTWATRAASIATDRPTIASGGKALTRFQRVVQVLEARSLALIGENVAASHVATGAALVHDTASMWSKAPQLADSSAVRRLATGVAELLGEVKRLHAGF